jgi:Cu/Ag efflux protein CusF
MSLRHRRQTLSTWLAAIAVVAATVGRVPPALAHGGHDHVMGTIKTVDATAKKVEVATRQGKVVAVLLDDKTKYLRGTAAAALKDLAVGERVVIDAGMENGQLVAREVRLQPAKAEAPAK